MLDLDSNAYQIAVRTHTALHIVKGAVVKVMGAEWTAGVFVEGYHGRLTVKLDRKPSDDEILQVEREANSKVSEDVEILRHELDRSEAEARFGSRLYDVFVIPAHVTRLSVVEIPGWNVNACREEHTLRTGDVGRIHVGKTRFRPNKGLLEIGFDVET